MTAEKIKEIVRCGETSTVQFKKLFKTAEDVANELAAFSNSNGGQIFIGVDDKTGEILGLDYDQLREIGSLVASAADDRVRPAVFPQVETEPVDGKAVMIVTVKKGPDAPYTNKKGEIYVKQGPDKRRVSDNNEILRIFAESGSFQPDRQSIRGTSIKDLDRYLLDEFFQNSLGKSADNLGIPLETALKNLFILDEDGQATLGGMMFFGINPQRFCPAFNIKAVWFYGNSIGGTEYRSSRDIGGTIPRMFKLGMEFIDGCLLRRQEGQNFNSIGVLEIPEIALTELLQNALVHRSWLKPAPIRILVFDNRVEIVSPGALPPSLTVADIKLGNAFQRNQLIANLCAKTMDYRGLGSGIIRALQTDANIEFQNEASGDQFRVILWRTEQKSKEETPSEKEPDINSKEKSKEKEIVGKEKGKEKIFELLKSIPGITSSELQEQTGLSRSGVEKIIRQLKEAGKIRRIGPDKGGHWEVMDRE